MKKEQNIDTLVYNYTIDSIAIGDIKNFRNDINKFLIPCDLDKLETELNRYKDMKDKLFPKTNSFIGEGQPLELR